MTKSFDERAKEERAPIQYRIYKGISGKNGALRLNLKRPYANQNPKKSEGVIFLEAAAAIGRNEYDWDNKIIIALSIVDIPKIILYLRSPNHSVFDRSDGKLKLIHDKGAGTAKKGQEVKTLEIAKSERTSNFMFNVYESSNGTNKSASIPVSPDEVIAIGTLLQAAIPVIMAWTEGPPMADML